MNKLKEKLWMLSGANVFILRTAPSDQSKFSWIGVSLLLTALTATITFGFAVSTVFESYFPYGFLASLIWGLIILSIDCMVVASISDHQRSTKFKIPWSLMLRVIISIFIGLVIAKPLEFKIFEKEIQDRRVMINMADCASVARLSNNQRVNQVLALSVARDSLSLASRQYDTTAQCLVNVIKRENYGEGGVFVCGGKTYDISNVPGRSLMYNKREEQRQEADSLKLATTKKYLKVLASIDSVNHVIDRGYESCTEDVVSKEVKNTKPSILEAYVALNMISSEDDAKTGIAADSANQAQAMRSARINQQKEKKAAVAPPLSNAVLRARSAKTGIDFVTLLIVLIELCPVMLKTIQKTPAYDAALDRYLKDVTGEDYDYLELTAKYPFLGDTNAFTQAYKKRREMYGELIPDLEKINEMNSRANMNYETLSSKLNSEKEIAREVDREAGKAMKSAQVNVINEVMSAWEAEMLKKLKDDPSQFWSKTADEGNKEKPGSSGFTEDGKADH